MQQYLQERGVEYVVHFTRAENLPSIFALGLLGRTDTEIRQAGATFNDHYRYDYLPNAICCSISFPNYRMFYRLRQENAQVDWAVIRLTPEILWTKGCIFCQDNAANSAVAHMTLDERRGLPALQRMFIENDGLHNRARLGIPTSYCTKPQAEVLVLNPIEPHWIIDVMVDEKHRIRDIGNLTKIVRICGEQTRFYHAKGYFDARIDDAHWRGLEVG